MLLEFGLIYTNYMTKQEALIILNNPTDHTPEELRAAFEVVKANIF